MPISSLDEMLDALESSVQDLIKQAKDVQERIEYIRETYLDGPKEDG